MKTLFKYRLSAQGKMSTKRLRSKLKVIMQSALAFLLISMFLNCENKDRFYRPDVPEMLCCIGIIDADDTTDYFFSLRDIKDSRNSMRYILFEKSFQSEYSKKASSLINEFSFNISSDRNEIFSYSNSILNKDILKFELPDSLNFISGEKYFLIAGEKGTRDISAEIIVPAFAPELKLISLEKEIIKLPVPQECTGNNNIKNAIISVTFNTNNTSKQYYAILLKGTGYSYSSLPPPVTSYLDFSIRDCNSPGFFAVMHGLSMNHWKCINNRVYLDESQVNAYFIEGNKIPDGKCNISISAKFQDTYSIIDILMSIQIKLLSIPEELYSFEKSLYTYSQIKKDPFSEPVYLNGNIKEGNGIFAICRSSDLTYILPFPPAF